MSEGGARHAADLEELRIERPQAIELDGRATFRPVRMNRADHDPSATRFAQHLNDAILVPH